MYYDHPDVSSIFDYVSMNLLTRIQYLPGCRCHNANVPYDVIGLLPFVVFGGKHTLFYP